MAKLAGLKTRLKGLRREMDRLGLPALLVTQPANIRHLTGFAGHADAALVTPEALYLVVDFRYVTQAAEQAPFAELVQVMGASYDDALLEAIALTGAPRLAFEADSLPVARHMAISWRRPELELVPTRGLVERGRDLKDATEVAALRKAADITSRAIAHALSVARPGMSEREVAAEVEAVMWREGAEDTAFPTLVATGERTALPHPRPGEAIIRPGDFLMIDAGARVNGYCADMTRTIVVGTPTQRQHDAWHAVELALLEGLAAVHPGVTGREVDAACREALRRRGWADAFGHDTGHGVGLEIHEAPRLAQDSDEVLEPGMVITVEPGLYVPGWGGVRLEQLALVTPAGAEVLTTLPVAMAAPCGTTPGRL